MNGNNIILPTKTRHAALPIYRPPSLRDGNVLSGDKGRLNVHAKEFVMVNAGQKYSGNKYAFSPNEDSKSYSSKWNDTPSKCDKPFPLNSSKSNGNVAFSFSKPDSSQSTDAWGSNYSLQKTKSIGDVLSNNVNHANSKVQFKTSFSDKNNNQLNKDRKLAATPPVLGSLKRSKSLGAADALKLMEMKDSFPNYSPKFTEFNLFPQEMHKSISQAIQNANRISDKDKIVLARLVVENAIKDNKFSLPAAKLCIIIMEKDKSGAFSDSLLNTCQMLYEKKETCFQTGLSKFAYFLSFLTEIFSELKRSKLQIRLSSDPITPPKITLLILICRCCEDILVQKETHTLPAIECLFLALTSLGRDIECEFPVVFKKLFTHVRMVFLKGDNGPQIQKTLLQLIELRAANWQLPVSALNFYYPKMSN